MSRGKPRHNPNKPQNKLRSSHMNYVEHIMKKVINDQLIILMMEKKLLVFVKEIDIIV